MIVKENYTEKLVGHASIDSTAIVGREKACRKNTPKIKLKKKRGRKSKAEKAALAEQELSETQTRRLELQPNRTLAENVGDLTHRTFKGDILESSIRFNYQFTTFRVKVLFPNVVKFKGYNSSGTHLFYSEVE